MRTVGRAWKRWTRHLSGAFLITLVAALLVVAAPSMKPTRWADFAFFILLALLAEVFPVTLSRYGSMSFAVAVDLASILVLGPPMAVWAVTIGRITGWFTHGQRAAGWYRLACHILANGAAGLMYFALGGSRNGEPATTYPLSLLAAFLVYELVVTGIPALIKTIEFQVPLALVWFKEAKSGWLWHTTMGVLGAGAAHLYVRVSRGVGLEGLLLFLVFILLVIYATRLYAGMWDIYWETVESLVASIDAKDRYTRGHSQRVAAYAVAIGRKLMLGDEELRTLFCAALLHDVGKIGMEEAILNKPKSLTREEYEVVKEHPVTGYQIVREVPFLAGLADLIRHHHEWYDGSSYPDGLKGEEIPLGARIIAIGDAFDAMTSERAYRQTMSRDEAVMRLRLGAGKQFDPRLVELFIRAIESEPRWDADVFASRYSLDPGGQAAGW